MVEVHVVTCMVGRPIAIVAYNAGIVGLARLAQPHDVIFLKLILADTSMAGFLEFRQYDFREKVCVCVGGDWQLMSVVSEELFSELR